MSEYTAVMWLFALLVLLFDVYVYYRFRYSQDVLEHANSVRNRGGLKKVLESLEQKPERKEAPVKAAGPFGEEIVPVPEFGDALGEFSNHFEAMTREIDFLKTKLGELQALKSETRFAGAGDESADFGTASPA